MARDINGHIIYGPPPKSDEEWRKEGEKFARAIGLNKVENDSSTNTQRASALQHELLSWVDSQGLYSIDRTMIEQLAERLNNRLIRCNL